MKTVDIKTCCRINFSNAPEARIESIADPTFMAVLPEQIPLIRPRLLVTVGDRVRIGTPLYEDKANEDIKFRSPGSGRVADITYGERRVIREIVIRKERDESWIQFEPIDEAGLAGTDREQFIDALMARGVWPLIRSLPFRAIADRNESPAALWVPLDPSDPFQPASEIYLEGEHKRFAFGIRALNRLGVPVYVCESAAHPMKNELVRRLVTHRVSGAYPAEDPGVVNFHTKRAPEENRAWFIKGQDVLLLAEALQAGKYPTSRIVAVSGVAEPNNRHVKTRLGVPLKSLVGSTQTHEAYRWVTGGLFSGYTASPDTYLGLYETSLSLIAEARFPEFLGFMRPGLHKPTCTRTFLSALRKRPLPTDAGLHGEHRACVNCGNCMRACPVDIWPQYTYKSLYAEEIEEALQHGLLDCVECGLCSYVCPSKVELTQTFQATRHAYYRDRI